VRHHGPTAVRRPATRRLSRPQSHLRLATASRRQTATWIAWNDTYRHHQLRSRHRVV